MKKLKGEEEEEEGEEVATVAAVLFLVVNIFYGPLFLAVTCSVLVCLRSPCVDFFRETTSGFISVFSASWFDSGHMFLPVYGGLVL